MEQSLKVFQLSLEVFECFTQFKSVEIKVLAEVLCCIQAVLARALSVAC